MQQYLLYIIIAATVTSKQGFFVFEGLVHEGAHFLNFPIQALQLERKQLAQQWYGSLIGMRRRDEAYAAMQEALK